MQWHSGQYASDAMKQPHVTLLDHFAGQAMQGLCAGFKESFFTDNCPDSAVTSKKAYEMAKEMLKARQEALKESEVPSE